MKKKYLLISVFTLSAILFGKTYVFSNQNGAEEVYTGSSSFPNACATSGCHTGNTINAAGGTLSVEVMDGATPVTQYIGGKTYQVQVTLNHNSAVVAGFAAEVDKGTTATNAGTISSTSNTVKVSKGFATKRTYATHTRPAALSGGSASWSFNWVAPAAGTGAVTIFAAGNAANNDGNTTGDKIYKTTASLTEMTSSIAEQALFQSSLSAYPNPVASTLHISYSLPAAARVSAELYTLDGKLLRVLNTAEQQQGDNQLTADMSGMAKGVYTLRVTAGNTVKTTNIIKQ